MGVKLSDDDIVKIEVLGDVAMTTVFGTTLATWPVTGDKHEISSKGWLIFSQPLHLLVALSGFVVVVVGISLCGRVSGWELTR